jgi:hypothetical protein
LHIAILALSVPKRCHESHLVLHENRHICHRNTLKHVLHRKICDNAEVSVYILGEVNNLQDTLIILILAEKLLSLLGGKYHLVQVCCMPKQGDPIRSNSPSEPARRSGLGTLMVRARMRVGIRS